MKKLILEFINTDYWGRDTYKDEDGNIFKDIDMGSVNIYLCTANGVDGEPNTPIEKLDQYKNATIQLIAPPTALSNEEQFNYMMLSRLEQDCKYFLGNGNRNTGRLWAGNVKDQIIEMKKIYNSFTKDKQPDWLTYNDILEYEKQMTDEVKKSC